ncbi:hypothetical protein [Streptomyces ureilyticus]|uniref:Uncharacterized protein n=1 Tax=Streptomyces ureilyticus TaxID=1775131 RepID=A0ABX0DHY7_9ACTN|nr:hypothetical protein [Streptomyces ureilyticus]NGO41472.1 hypothetical protein [Streptomyces ureilyticus]
MDTAQLPGNPLPDGWSDEKAREAVPYHAVTGRGTTASPGRVTIPALRAAAAACVLPAGIRR